MAARVPLMSSIQRWKLDRISYIECRLRICQSHSPINYRTYRVVKHPILISLVSIHFHGEAMDITDCIRRATLRTNSRNTQENVCLFPCGVEEAGGCDIRAFLGAFEYTVCSVWWLNSYSHILWDRLLTRLLWHERHWNGQFLLQFMHGKETYRSGILSREKCASDSINWVSWSKSRPPPLPFRTWTEVSFLAYGQPALLACSMVVHGWTLPSARV